MAEGPRRRLRILAGLSLPPLCWLSWTMVRAHGLRRRGPRRRLIRGPLPEGLSVDGPVALWREGRSVSAVSLRCPHLGCTVRPTPDGALACPCHGSRFDARGRVARGPAKSRLEPLRVGGEDLLVDLPS